MSCSVHDEDGDSHRYGRGPGDDDGTQQRCDRVHDRASHRDGDRGDGDDR